MASVAPACRSALQQATARWPNRSTASDGLLGDARHQAKVSDHNSGNAFDLTHDLAHGVDCHELSEFLKNMPDPRVKYIIWNKRIWNPSVAPRWRAYSGDNPHTKHMHVSILVGARDDVSPWWQPAHVDTAPVGITWVGPSYSEDRVKPIEVRFPNLDGGGNGWLLLDIDPKRVVSYNQLGPYPPHDGYWNSGIITHQDRGGKTILCVTEGPPRGTPLVTLWVAE